MGERARYSSQIHLHSPVEASSKTQPADRNRGLRSEMGLAVIIFPPMAYKADKRIITKSNTDLRKNIKAEANLGMDKTHRTDKQSDELQA